MMDRSPQIQRKNKRSSKTEDDMNSWDCSVCTYKNTPEAFKCLMCDARKGTSTRKPRPNPQIAQPTANSPSPPKNQKRESSQSKRSDDVATSESKTRAKTRLKNIDRKSAQSKEITVNNVTVVITEYKLKKGKTSADSSSRSSSSRANSDGPSGDFSDTSSDSADV